MCRHTAQQTFVGSNLKEEIDHKCTIYETILALGILILGGICEDQNIIICYKILPIPEYNIHPIYIH